MMIIVIVSTSDVTAVAVLRASLLPVRCGLVVEALHLQLQRPEFDTREGMWFFTFILSGEIACYLCNTYNALEAEKK